MVKACSRCGRRLPADLAHFYGCREHLDGLGSWCRPCKRRDARLRAKMRRWARRDLNPQ